jgi:hypothetical protein
MPDEGVDLFTGGICSAQIEIPHFAACAWCDYEEVLLTNLSPRGELVQAL